MLNFVLSYLPYLYNQLVREGKREGGRRYAHSASFNDTSILSIRQSRKLTIKKSNEIAENWVRNATQHTTELRYSYTHDYNNRYTFK